MPSLSDTARARGPAEAAPAPASNVPEFSVTEISRALKRVVEGEFGHVRVRGEISGFKRAASGHMYMTLKDEESVLDGVCWRGTAGRLSVAPEDGLEVIVTGRLTTYGARSKYQLVIEAMEMAGEGALLKLLEERRRKLAAEGLFDAERKRALPFLPAVIGVVTSPTGAVIRDILHRLADRFPRHVLLWPVQVQGETAAAQVAAAIAGFNGLAPDGPVPRPDLLIVARGGGSLEDLWAFNEEVVVRAAAASDIPLISAVGHETDTTLIDHAADRRAPTPTAAAEMAVPVRTELRAQVADDERRLISSMGRMLEERRLRVESLGRGLPDPRSVMETAAQRLDDRAERLAGGIRTWLRQQAAKLDLAASGLRRRTLDERLARGGDRLTALTDRLRPLPGRRLADATTRLSGAAALLESYSYERVLDRGFALVQDADGGPVTSAAAAAPGDRVAIRFHDGQVGATLDDDVPAAEARKAPAKPAARKPRARARSKAGTKDDPQGTLL